MKDIAETMTNKRTGETIVVVESRKTTEIEYKNVEVGREEIFCQDCQCYEDSPIFKRKGIPVGTLMFSVRRGIND